MADPTRDFLNRQCRIYREIANIAAVHRSIPALRFGRMYMREISGNGRDFGRPIAHPCTLAFSRMLAGQEVVVAYNTSTTQARADFVCVDARLQRDGGDFKFIYGGAGTVPVQKHPDPNNGTRSLRIELQPMQFAILTQV
jgi:alpha-amylase